MDRGRRKLAGVKMDSAQKASSKQRRRQGGLLFQLRFPPKIPPVHGLCLLCFLVCPVAAGGQTDAAWLQTASAFLADWSVIPGGSHGDAQTSHPRWVGVGWFSLRSSWWFLVCSTFGSGRRAASNSTQSSLPWQKQAKESIQTWELWEPWSLVIFCS